MCGAVQAVSMADSTVKSAWSTRRNPEKINVNSIVIISSFLLFQHPVTGSIIILVVTSLTSLEVEILPYRILYGLLSITGRPLWDTAVHAADYQIFCSDTWQLLRVLDVNWIACGSHRPPPCMQGRAAETSSASGPTHRAGQAYKTRSGVPNMGLWGHKRTFRGNSLIKSLETWCEVQKCACGPANELKPEEEISWWCLLMITVHFARQ